AAVLAISIGLFNSIMFPVIFTITLERSTAPAPATSGLLCMAIVGGALVPLLFAFVADVTTSRSLAFQVPMLCYLLITAFELAAHRRDAQRQYHLPQRDVLRAGSGGGTRPSGAARQRRQLLGLVGGQGRRGGGVARHLRGDHRHGLRRGDRRRRAADRRRKR